MARNTAPVGRMYLLCTHSSACDTWKWTAITTRWSRDPARPKRSPRLQGALGVDDGVIELGQFLP